MKPKSIHNLENRMDGLEPASVRYKTLEAARDFKSSWIKLGQHLFTVYQDKLYKDWGYLTFEAYSAKEIGIRQTTAVKLLKSYSFLEKEEPAFIRSGSIDEMKPDRIPGFESVNVLRLAKANENVSEKDYRELRQTVLDHPKEDTEVKKKLRYILKAGPQKELPEGDRKKAFAAKLTLVLENSKLTCSQLFPEKMLKKIDELIDLLADYK